MRIAGRLKATHDPLIYEFPLTAFLDTYFYLYFSSSFPCGAVTHQTWKSIHDVLTNEKRDFARS